MTPDWLTALGTATSSILGSLTSSGVVGNAQQVQLQSQALALSAAQTASTATNSTYITLAVIGLVGLFIYLKVK